MVSRTLPTSLPQLARASVDLVRWLARGFGVLVGDLVTSWISVRFGDADGTAQLSTIGSQESFGAVEVRGGAQS